MMWRYCTGFPVWSKRQQSILAHRPVTFLSMHYLTHNVTVHTHTHRSISRGACHWPTIQLPPLYFTSSFLSFKKSGWSWRFVWVGDCGIVSAVGVVFWSGHVSTLVLGEWTVFTTLALLFTSCSMISESGVSLDPCFFWKTHNKTHRNQCWEMNQLTRGSGNKI